MSGISWAHHGLWDRRQWGEGSELASEEEMTNGEKTGPTADAVVAEMGKLGRIRRF